VEQQGIKPIDLVVPLEQWPAQRIVQGEDSTEPYYTIYQEVQEDEVDKRGERRT
jgi:hypothetical protein